MVNLYDSYVFNFILSGCFALIFIFIQNTFKNNKSKFCKISGFIYGSPIFIPLLLYFVFLRKKENYRYFKDFMIHMIYGFLLMVPLFFIYFVSAKHMISIILLIILYCIIMFLIYFFLII